MSWPIPSSGQWNPGMAHNMPTQLTSNMPSSYTPDQWAMMQQQNWQQWVQWQQQQAQWQNQYGDKYAEQVQAMQTMPPLPVNNVPPPAPPPPDQPPPPPPPHENNQPLYGKSNQPAPLAPPQNQNNTSGNINKNTGNNQNWSHSESDNKSTSAIINKATPAVNKPSLATVNAEALKKLAEEEILFDKQFKKWEEEIEKWRSENVNHPDKQAYRDYEKKFESCRAQLLERRQQMNQKKASLLGNAPLATSSASTSSNVSVSISPLMQNTHNRNIQPQCYYNNMNKPVQNYPDSQIKQQFNNQEHQMPHLNYNRTENQDSHYNQQFNQQDYQKPQPNFKTNGNKNIEPHDRYESHQHMGPEYSVTNTDFLPTNSSKKNIPGLDLVPEDKTANKREEVINLSDDTDRPQFHQQPQHSGPDYSKISKGINNILGDEKIMNILGIVRGGNAFNNQSHNSGNTTNIEFCEGTDTSIANKQWEKYQNIERYENRQNMPYGKLGQGSNLQQDQGPNYSPIQQQKRAYNDQIPNDYDSKQQDRFYNRQDMSQEQYFNNESSEHDGMGILPHRQGLPTVRGNYPPSRLAPLQQGSEQQNVNYTRSPNANQHNDNISGPSQPSRAKWVDDPLFTPSIIVEYEHKPLRLKAREFIEPVHTFDYNHKSKDEEYKKKDFEKEVDELFSRKSRNFDEGEFLNTNRYSRDLYYRDLERRAPREELERRFPRDDYYSKGALRDDYFDRQRVDDRYYDERRRDDRDRFSRREDPLKERERMRERERSRHQYTDRNRDSRRDEKPIYFRSQERDARKRGLSKDSDISDSSSIKKSKVLEPNSSALNQSNGKTHIVMIDDILEPPGRDIRPEKNVIILRGPPGSGKSYLAKLIRDREAEHGGTVRIMSIDDYFMQEGEIEEKDPSTGKIVKKPTLKYEYDEKSEEVYLNSLKRAFKRTITDGYFTFLIYDAVNDQLKCYADLWNFARQQGFQVYICTMELDPQICYKRNIHNRSLGDIEVVCARFFPTPAHHIQLDATTLLQNASITDVHMEDAVDDPDLEDSKDTEVENIFMSKWEKMDDAVQLARLDGTSRPLRPAQPSMEDYLQLDDWIPTTAKPGKKTVRWADIEERRQQEKMRAIGFVVGQTDWNRMTDPTMGSGALTKTKYIERVKRN